MQTNIPSYIISYICKEALLLYLQKHSPCTHMGKLYSLIHKGEYNGGLFNQKLLSLLLDFSVLYIDDNYRRWEKSLNEEVKKVVECLGRKKYNLHKIRVTTHNSSSLSVYDLSSSFDMIIGLGMHIDMIEKVSDSVAYKGCAILVTPSSWTKQRASLALRNRLAQQQRIKRIVNFYGYMVLGQIADISITELVHDSKEISQLSLDRPIKTKEELAEFLGPLNFIRNVRSLTGSSATVYWNIEDQQSQKILLDLQKSIKTTFLGILNVSFIPKGMDMVLYKKNNNIIRFTTRDKITHNHVVDLTGSNKLFIKCIKESMLSDKVLAAILSSRVFVWYYNIVNGNIDEQEKIQWENAMKDFFCPSIYKVKERKYVIEKLVDSIIFLESLPFSLESHSPHGTTAYKMHEVLDMVMYELFFFQEMSRNDLVVSHYLKAYMLKYKHANISTFASHFHSWFNEMGNPVRDRLTLLPIRSKDYLSIIHFSV